MNQLLTISMWQMQVLIVVLLFIGYYLGMKQNKKQDKSVLITRMETSPWGKYMVSIHEDNGSSSPIIFKTLKEAENYERKISTAE